jgi:carboxyl-terminal processing protease
LRLVVAIVALLLLAGSALAEPRVALVIGNSGYGAEIGRLANPANDAGLMAKTLRGIGFTVIEIEDADQQVMKRAIADFGYKLSDAGFDAIGLFYYAGHGLQFGGENYLIPIGAKIQRETDLDIEAVPLTLILKQMDFADGAVNIVILDACRNNPLSRGFRDSTRGLAETRVKPHGSFIAYSTAPGETAADGNGANSPYTIALADSIVTPGLGIEEVFRDIRGKVLAATDKKQTPWDSSSLTAPFYFVPAAAAPAPVAAAPAPSNAVDPKTIELAFWEAIKDSKSADDFAAYLEKFPNGDFVPLAKNRLKALTGESVAPVVPAAPPVTASRTDVDPKAIELAFWDAVADSDSPEDIEAYLAKYPKGDFAQLAKLRLKALRSTSATMPEPVTPPPAAAPVLPEIVDTTAELYAKDKARLRAAPAADAAVVSRLDAGAKLTATGRSSDGKWWRVSLPDGRQGFIAASVVSDQPAKPAAAVAAVGQPAAPSQAVSGDDAKVCPMDSGAPAEQRLPACRRLLETGKLEKDQRHEALNNLGAAQYDLGEYEEALRNFRAASELDPNDGWPYYNMGLAHQKLGHYAEARTVFEKAVPMLPDSADAFYNRGRSRGNVGETDLAIEDLRAAIAMDASVIDYYDQLATLQLAKGEVDAAVAAADKGVAADPAYWGTGAVLTYYVAGKFDAAIGMIERALKEDPNYGYWYLWKALAQKGKGDSAGAAATLEEGLSHVADNWPAPLLQRVAGKIDEDELRDGARLGSQKRQAEQLSEVDFYIGELALLAGDRETARRAMQNCVNARIYYYYETAAAKARLAQLQ